MVVGGFNRCHGGVARLHGSHIAKCVAFVARRKGCQAVAILGMTALRGSPSFCRCLARLERTVDDDLRRRNRWV